MFAMIHSWNYYICSIDISHWMCVRCWTHATTLIYAVTFNYLIFSNNYRGQRVNVMSNELMYSFHYYLLGFIIPLTSWRIFTCCLLLLSIEFNGAFEIQKKGINVSEYSPISSKLLILIFQCHYLHTTYLYHIKSVISEGR